MADISKRYWMLALRKGHVASAGSPPYGSLGDREVATFLGVPLLYDTKEKAKRSVGTNEAVIRVAVKFKEM